jgi:hypothetical protein
MREAASCKLQAAQAQALAFRSAPHLGRSISPASDLRPSSANILRAAITFTDLFTDHNKFCTTAATIQFDNFFAAARFYTHLRWHTSCGLVFASLEPQTNMASS